ncbi:MAG: glycoside hydrolase family 2 protein [Clostridiales bacterium]|nr:glycoside hydrolase family 2 protein [Clostridiales bacterium]
MKRIAIDAGWRFGETEDGYLFASGPAAWREVDLPHDFILTRPRRAEAAGGASTGFSGDGQAIYEKDLDIPADWRGRRVLLDVDGAYANAEVSLEGELLALHPYGYTPFLTDLTPALQFGGRNRLRVATQSRQPSSRWYSGGGLYRGVALWVGGAVYVSPWDIFVTTPVARPDGARAAAQIAVTSALDRGCEATVRARAIGPDGAVAAQAQGVVALCAGGRAQLTLEMPIDRPALWDLDQPHRYTLAVEVSAEGEVTDQAEVRFGIRSIEIDAERGFRLNGRPLKLKGGCVHHDNGILGACAYPAAEGRKIRLLKEAGYNAVRSSHNPPSLKMLEECDRQGMLMMDEAFDVWRQGKKPMDYHLYFEDWWARDIEAMVLRDRNHPCVFSYSIGNEIGERDGSSDGAAWSARLADAVRALDPTRPVTSAVCEIFPQGGAPDPARWAERTGPYCRPLDLVGYNYLYDRYETDGRAFPGRVIAGTESMAHHSYDNWQAVLSNNHVIGDFLWTAWDYMGEAGLGRVMWGATEKPENGLGKYPWRTALSSDFDLCGNPTPHGRYHRILWGEEAGPALFTAHPARFGQPFTGLGWHWRDVQDSWNFDREWLGRPVAVEAYADADEVEFLLNGRPLGAAKVEKLIATIDVPYEPGELVAVARRGGAEVGRMALATAGAPARLALRADRTALCADRIDLCFVEIEIQDAQGRRVPDAALAIEAEAARPGALAGIGNAAPVTEDDAKESSCRAFGGRALCAVKALEKGVFELCVRAEGLPEARLTFKAE